MKSKSKSSVHLLLTVVFSLTTYSLVALADPPTRGTLATNPHPGSYGSGDDRLELQGGATAPVSLVNSGSDASPSWQAGIGYEHSAQGGDVIIRLNGGSSGPLLGTSNDRFVGSASVAGAFIYNDDHYGYDRDRSRVGASVLLGTQNIVSASANLAQVNGGVVGVRVRSPRGYIDVNPVLGAVWNRNNGMPSLQLGAGVAGEYNFSNLASLYGSAQVAAAIAGGRQAVRTTASTSRPISQSLSRNDSQNVTESTVNVHETQGALHQDGPGFFGMGTLGLRLQPTSTLGFYAQADVSVYQARDTETHLNGDIERHNNTIVDVVPQVGMTLTFGDSRRSEASATATDQAQGASRDASRSN